MRRITLSLAIFAVSLSYGQTAEINTSLPTVIAPAPSVGALMKFEEIPVSNYTGVPDISIPLFSTPTRAKNIAIDISLKYHPAAVNADAVASDAGLGWSLFAGGTISRTVKGLPDENKKTGKPEVGLYHTTLSSYKNNFYAFVDHIANGTAMAQVDISKFLWDVNEKAKYDTEHDLWQYDFMGYSGRFYIKKNMTTGVLDVIKLDADNSLKIVNNYSTAETDDKYSPISFTIFDDKGNSFLFDVAEETTTSSLSFMTFIDLSTGNTLVRELKPYKSAFHLSKVFDTNQNVLIECTYSPFSKEIAIDGSHTLNKMQNHNSNLIAMSLIGSGCQETVSQYEPLEISSSHTTNTKVRKLSEISVDGFAKVKFHYSRGRADGNMFHPDSSYIFEGITVSDWKKDSIKKVQLQHSYLTGIDQRLSLSKVSIGNFENSKKEEYELFYRNNNPYGETIRKDLWGFMSAGGDPTFSTMNLLQKMTLPSGGGIIYNFEQNQYSHIGATSLVDFDENPNNWEPQISDLISFYTTGNTLNPLQLTIADEQDVTLEANVYRNALHPEITMNWHFDVVKIVNSVPQNSGPGISYEDCGFVNSGSKSIHLGQGEYQIKFYREETGNTALVLDSATIQMHYRTRILPERQYLYGGGNRIKTIAYFESSDVPQDFYELTYTNFLPSREKKYQYNFFDTLKSSGSLVYYKPIFSYNINKRLCVQCGTMGNAQEYTYSVFTTFNNLNIIKTKGADIGYQNVTISETGNGKSEFIYSSPIDSPNTEEEMVPPSPPFLQEPNYDYKRGLEKNKKIYNESGQLLSETITIPVLEHFVEQTGIRTLNTTVVNCSISNNYQTYDAYLSEMQGCYGNCDCFCGEAPDFIGFLNIIEPFGWVKSRNVINKNYFYTGNTQRFVITDEVYEYNQLNKNLASYTITNSLNEIQTKAYFYHTGNSPSSQNRISEIERIDSLKDSVLLSSNKIIYSDSWDANDSWLPQVIQSKRESQAFEDRVKFTKYDEYGHALEMQQADGTKICYIWGYNKTQPVAKIENSDYNNIPTALIENIWQVSDLPNSSEQDVIDSLNKLRANNALPQSMVTTFTYKPLVGVSTITDPKGYQTSYTYDEFGMLKSMRDNENNIISENNYHYRTQN